MLQPRPLTKGRAVGARSASLLLVPALFLLTMVAVGVSTTEPAKAAFTKTTATGTSSFAAAVMAAPTSLAADRSTPGQVDLSWTATTSTYASGYDIYRSSTSGCCYSYLASVIGQATTAYTDTNASTSTSFVASTTTIQGTAATSMPLAVPTGVASGDLLIAHISAHDARTFSTLTGWTQLLTATTGGVSTGVWYRVATGSEPASYTFTWNTSDEAVGAMLAYRGVNTSSPIQTWGWSSGSSNAPTAPSVTTTSANTTVVRLFGSDDINLPSPTSNTYPSGTTGRYALKTTSSAVGEAGADQLRTSAGATGAASFNLTASSDWITLSVAIAPPAISTYYYVVGAHYLSWTSANSNQA
jgi:hypothetical protein